MNDIDDPTYTPTDEQAVWWLRELYEYDETRGARYVRASLSRRLHHLAALAGVAPGRSKARTYRAVLATNRADLRDALDGFARRVRRARADVANVRIPQILDRMFKNAQAAGLGLPFMAAVGAFADALDADSAAPPADPAWNDWRAWEEGDAAG